MRSIILNEVYLQEAVESVMSASSPSAVHDKIIERVYDVIGKKCCGDMADRLKDAIRDAEFTLPEQPDTSTICDAILDQAQRVGVVSEVL
jgi:hypothetical protein